VGDDLSATGGDPGDVHVSSTERQRVASARRRIREAPRPNLVERRMSRFMRQPPSIRLAASVIVTATALIVVGGGALMRVFDHHEYPSIWLGMWWAIQTVTTVGYGDVTPKDVVGRLIASFIMLEGIAFVAIITAAITSSFVARAEQERDYADDAVESKEEARLNARFDAIDDRLDSFETLLRGLRPPTDQGGTP
jgi:voltage-gated potassium channel